MLGRQSAGVPSRQFAAPETGRIRLRFHLSSDKKKSVIENAPDRAWQYEIGQSQRGSPSPAREEDEEDIVVMGEQAAEEGDEFEEGRCPSIC